MLPTRIVPASTSTSRKSRLDGKPSLLPRRRPGSTDRLSTEARRPSTTGLRSNSAEPPRTTIAGSRPSRDTSATKIPRIGASRIHQGERFGQSSMTPLRSSHYYNRPTTTPVRTPSEDRSGRCWQASLERALAFVTVKDQRPLSNPAWQRATLARVQAALAARAAGFATGRPALMRPLTIARFLDIISMLLQSFNRDVKINNENYITKLPHLSKRLLYPGQVSKSWLRTVNTLHAFPHALALIAYLLDLDERIDTPVSDEWYAENDELTRLRRDYLYKCWIRFQNPGHQFEDLNEEYLKSLKALLGNDEEKIIELKEIIKKHEQSLDDETEAAERADEARRVERRDALHAALRAERAGRHATRTAIDTAKAACSDKATELTTLNHEIDKINAENQQMKADLERQSMSVQERARLLDRVDYDTRVHDSKRALAEQIAKMVTNKECEVALWLKKTLDSCGQYQQRLIRLSSRFPELAELAIDEKELMDSACVERMAAALTRLRAVAAGLAARRTQAQRDRAARALQQETKKQETEALIEQTKKKIEQADREIEAILAKEEAEAAAWAEEEKRIADRMEELRLKQEEYAKADAELEFWEKQDALWRAKLSELHAHVATQKREMARVLKAAQAKRVQLVSETIKQWNDKLFI